MTSWYPWGEGGTETLKHVQGRCFLPDKNKEILSAFEGAANTTAWASGRVEAKMIQKQKRPQDSIIDPQWE